MDKGTLLISLDFELFWGVLDCHTYDSYGKNVLGGRNAIPASASCMDLTREVVRYRSE